jgi:hypothetical protein
MGKPSEDRVDARTEQAIGSLSIKTPSQSKITKRVGTEFSLEVVNIDVLKQVPFSDHH